MIIAKSKWFKRRKYLGWGVDVKTKEGWIYIGAFITLLIGLPQLSPIIGEDISMGLFWTTLVIFLIDIFSVMWKLKLDERESKHEMIAERNSAWAMMIALIIILIGEPLYKYSMNLPYEFNFLILAVLLIGAITKTITNYKLDKND